MTIGRCARRVEGVDRRARGGYGPWFHPPVSRCLPVGYLPDGPETPAPGGAVCWATDRAGARVRVRWFSPVDPPARDRVIEVAGSLASLRHPALTRPLEVCAGDETVSWVEPAGAELCAPGSTLEVWQVVELATRLAGALAALHRRGIAQGPIGLADLAVDAAGQVRLSAAGMAAAAGGRPVDARRDGAELARLLSALGAGLPVQARDYLVEAARVAAAPAEVAARLQAFADPPSPAGGAIRTPAEGLLAALAELREHPDPAPTRGGRHRAGRRPIRLAGCAVAAVLALAGLLGAARWAGPVRAGPARLAVARGAAATGWTAVMTQLDAARCAALQAGQPAELVTAEIPGSPAYRADAGLLSRLAGRGLVARGLVVVLSRVSEVGGTSSAVTLRVVERLAAYRLVGGAGQPAVRVPAGPVGGYLFRLVRTPAGWRVVSATFTRA
jgi:hypothetical protein